MVHLAGIKDMSFVDLHGHITATVWVCGCNLKCPFCHNWKLADFVDESCRKVTIREAISEIVEKVKWNKGIVDYVHVTGGEPLLYPHFVVELGKELNKEGLKLSVNSNLTVSPDSIFLYVKEKEFWKRVDVIATDLKPVPSLLYGVEPVVVSSYVANWLKWIDIIIRNRKKLDFVEVRVPFPKGFEPEDILKDYFSKKMFEKLRLLVKKIKTTVIVQQLITTTETTPLMPRDKSWCKKHCDAPASEVRKFATTLENYLGVPVEIKIWKDEN